MHIFISQLKRKWGVISKELELCVINDFIYFTYGTSGAMLNKHIVIILQLPLVK